MVKENKLLTAVKSNNVSNVIKVLEKFAKQKSLKTKTKKLDFDSRDSYGLTVAHHAARNGNWEILETLLQSGAPFEVYDLHGLRPVSYACAEGHYKIVERLLQSGSSCSRINVAEHLTPLHLAAMYGYAEIVHLLLRYNADVTAVNREQRTALELACAYGKYNVINLLLAYTNQSKSAMTSSTTNAVGVVSQQMGQMMLYDAVAASPSANNSVRTHDHILRPGRHLGGGQLFPPGTPIVERYIGGGGASSSSPYGSSAAISTGSGSCHSNGSSHGSSHGGGCCRHGNHNSNNESYLQQLMESDHCRSQSYCSYGSQQQTIPYRALQSPRESNAAVSFGSDQQQQHKIDVPNTPSAVPCHPPTLDDADHVLSYSTDLRQNLREACFAVQARAILSFARETISFNVGDLITVLRQYHNGLAKGYVTSDGISGTGLLPVHCVEYLARSRSSAQPPTCCDRPLQLYRCALGAPGSSKAGNKSPEKTPVAAARLPLASRDEAVCDDEEEDDDASEEEDEEEEGESHSPIEIPPQMSSILTPASAKWTSSQQQQQQQQQQSCFCSSNGNKRNSVASLDSGRGSATDSKSVLSSSGGLSGQAGGDDVMIAWLRYIGLPSVCAAQLVAAGYDLPTLSKATPEDLNASGITSPQDRQFLKNHLSGISVCCDNLLPQFVPSSVRELLDCLKLSQYEEMLARHSFTQIEHLLGLSWEDLADIGIEKLGHQKKLSLAIERLSRLLTASGTNPSNKPVIPGNVRDQPESGPSSSRSYEELPYPAAVMMSPSNSVAMDLVAHKCSTTPRRQLAAQQQTVATANTPYQQPQQQQRRKLLLSKSDESVSSLTGGPSCCAHGDDLGDGRHARHHDEVGSLSSATSSSTSSSGSSNQDSGGSHGDVLTQLQMPHACSQISATSTVSAAAPSTHYFAHDNTGTVRVAKRPSSMATAAPVASIAPFPSSAAGTDNSCMREVGKILATLQQQLNNTD